ncbi:MAG: excalibur calcium-binding domain-containing protein [Nocardia sp.]|nr:excalibur calcium-binding domain-containing protein [Nocardia sp.]
MKYVLTLASAAIAAFAFAIATPAVAGAQTSNCHDSYTPCLPIVSDVDCEGGSGNGPVYTGRVTVIGPDDYGLDRDGDGIGCE